MGASCSASAHRQVEEKGEKVTAKAQEEKKTQKKSVGVAAYIGALLASALVNYVWKEDDESKHLLQGITNEGQLKFLERIDFIRYTGKEDDEDKYTAWAANVGHWKYTDTYDRSKYKSISWVDEAWGRVEKHEKFGLTGVVGYDIEEVIRDWLVTHGPQGSLDDWLKAGKDKDAFPSYERYSVCEAILVDPLFADMKHCVSLATVFVSHADSEPLLGRRANNGTGRESTMEMLDWCANSQMFQDKDDFRLDSALTEDGNGFEFMWIDYYSLRPNVKEWDPELVVELVRRIGKVVALLDEKMEFLSRSWCVFELYAAIKGQVKLLCQYKFGLAEDVESAFEFIRTVNAADAKCSDDKDKRMIDDFIEGLEGGFAQFNADIEKVIRDTNTT